MKTYQSMHGQYVYYESEEEYAQYGLKYLSYLPDDQAKVFFDEAYTKGEAPFQDTNGYKFVLMYLGGEYFLNSKK